MYEWFLGLVISYPRAFVVVGRLLFSSCVALAGLGMRLDRIGEKIGRAAARAHVEAPDVLAGLPWWLRIAIPETASGWLGLMLLALSSDESLRLRVVRVLNRHNERDSHGYYRAPSGLE